MLLILCSSGLAKYVKDLTTTNILVKFASSVHAFQLSHSVYFVTTKGSQEQFLGEELFLNVLMSVMSKKDFVYMNPLQSMI